MARPNGRWPPEQYRHTTYPNPASLGPKKRIIVCCDGTLQDGVIKKERWQYSNVLKLARSLHREDRRCDPPISQIVFYQSGVGAENNIYSMVVGGVTGEGLADKVQEAYAFVAHNYSVGDEIFLFGFSRGAYTARMVAEFIGAIGVLNVEDMDHFGEIFIAYQKRGKTTDDEERAQCEEKLAPFVSPKSNGKRNVELSGKFSIKVVGVFDTVGALGLPTELTHGSSHRTRIFGFVDRHLGPHVERALHALAANETRKDFEAATFHQTDEGRKREQVLRQCWFPGSHTDVGGGYQYFDLSSLTLSWMVANVEDLLAINHKYLMTHLEGHFAPWGEQVPHNSHYGAFAITASRPRKLPLPSSDVTHEFIHPSLLEQKLLRDDIRQLVSKNPDMIWSLLPFEEEVKARWEYDANRRVEEELDVANQRAADKEKKMQESFLDKAKKHAKHYAHKAEDGAEHFVLERPVTHDDLGRPICERTWLGNLLHRHVHGHKQLKD